MKRKRACVRVMALLGLALALVLGGASAAQAWSNGEPDPNGYGTHDWMLDVANQLAGDDGWVNVNVAYPVNDDPDTVYNDVYLHIYDRWGSLQLGAAPTAVKYRYGLAVWYLKCGKVDAASKQVSLLAHYYGDVWNPFHTNYELNTAVINALYHLRYEVDALTHEPATAAVAAADAASGGYHHVSNVASKTVAAATASRYSFGTGYELILASYYGWPPTAGLPPGLDTPTKGLLTQAAIGLRDIIVSIAEDAGY